MNRRLRASELSLHDVAERLAPWQPHVRTTSPGAPIKTELPPSVAPGDTTSLDGYRRQAYDRLHTYVMAACGYEHELATPIFNRVVAALETNLDRKVRAEQDHRR